jgi:fructuronate reductase
LKLDRANYLAKTGQELKVAPERIVHIGIGAFAKAHQIWYTQQVDRANEWGVVAFTGRSATAADQLREQDGLYTLIERGAAGDKFEVIDRIVRAEDGMNVTEFTNTLAKAEISIVTLTITEAGYGFTNDGKLDLENPAPSINRLAFALDMRRRLSGAPIALVSCDNIPNNGALLEAAVRNVFSTFDAEAIEWLEKNVSFVSTSIDRITPQTTAVDIEEVESKTSWQDNSVTVTEPFRDWILCGEFPAGRPTWENAGAKFVTEIEPFEKRKLWLLNGSHSILAYTGIARGHSTVAEAIADDHCLNLVNAFWNDAIKHLPAADLALDDYQAALLARFSNPRIAHQLRQIAIDGSTKLAVRIAPIATAELAAGRDAAVEAQAIGAWINFIRAGEFKDSQAEAIRLALTAESYSALIALLDPMLSKNANFVNLVNQSTQITERS